MMRISVVSLVLSGVMLAGGATDAAFIYPWSETPTVTDPDDAVGDGQDILRAWHVYDGTHHYFRMDLEGPPTSAEGNHGGIYGIYIDSAPGGGNNGSVEYIPGELDQINYILDSHFESTGVYFRHDYHMWSPYGGWFNYRPLEDDEHQESERGGATLEWKIFDIQIGTDFTWWAACITPGLAPGESSVTHDITDGVYFPEPATAATLLISLGLIAGPTRRRRLKPMSG